MITSWISLHREIQKHWLWADKPFSKGQAWIDMLLLANHSDNKFLLGNELIEIKEGSFVTSELKLMERWGWGKSKTRAFLDLLQSDSMIVKKTDHKKTTGYQPVVLFLYRFSVKKLPAAPVCSRIASASSLQKVNPMLCYVWFANQHKSQGVYSNE